MKLDILVVERIVSNKIEANKLTLPEVTQC